MKIDFKQQLISYDGEAMLEIQPKSKAKPGAQPETELVPLMLDAVAITSLMKQRDGELIEVTEKVHRFSLAKLISMTKDGPVTLEVEDLVFIKGLIGRYMPIEVVGAAFAMIEGDK